ncbi:hypothetical protein K458DRAFT_383798 [Lentithecium fluviatile CBS 122367]|uniref:Copper-fist domain-containing protein n=1 Tax=Lentithecium fluviatile CBS 122367 TaxID=1168545 RepID=A0A6G1JFC6_9PLEO|nr:hypothetical protein K458DRAFT_383798 [Lentithecium fluviatile CBS 122367]
MWADINGERKKVACGPCIRGHRSSKCDHRDRVLVEVRKPGRPLSSCPHPSGSCSCERVVINYTIPKTSECACPSERAQPSVGSSNSSRVQKSRNRKSTSTFNANIIEKAIKASQDGETDASSLITGTPTSESNDASAPSSASSTPRIFPSRKESQDVDLVIAEPSMPTSRPATSHSQGPSSCCQPKPAQPQVSSCCSNKVKEPPKPAQPQKSCCSGPVPVQTQQPQFPQPGGLPVSGNPIGNFPQYLGQHQQTPYSMLNSGSNFMAMPPPYNFNTPIYNHMASVYQPPASIPMTPMNNHVGTHATEHNCHCGDSCSCFGCAAHPNNATMIEYIRSMHQYMSTGQFGPMPPPTYDLPSYPHQAGYGTEAGMGYRNAAPTNYLPQNQMTFQAQMSSTMSMPHTPLAITSPWLQHSVQSPVQTSPAVERQFFGLANNPAPATAPEPAVTLKSEDAMQSPASAGSPSDGKSEETETLSPSSYFWQEMVLPGCNDATGTCQCGDGCECVGCLTHGGHNGVPLGAPTSNETETFADFMTSTATVGSGSNRFMAYSDAPT